MIEFEHERNTHDAEKGNFILDGMLEMVSDHNNSQFS